MLPLYYLRVYNIYWMSRGYPDIKEYNCINFKSVWSLEKDEVQSRLMRLDLMLCLSGARGGSRGVVQRPSLGANRSTFLMAQGICEFLKHENRTNSCGH